jgi:hypothetical protein
MSKQLRRPWLPNGGLSDKLDKQQDNRSIRKRDKSLIKQCREDDLPLKDRVDEWNYNKDGKHRVRKLNPCKKYTLYQLRKQNG